jgi:hypothetical protein
MELGLESRLLRRRLKYEIELGDFSQIVLHRAAIRLRFIDYGLKKDNLLSIFIDRIQEEIALGIREKSNNQVHAIETSLERVFTILKDYIKQRVNTEAAFSLFYHILMEEVRKMVIKVIRCNRRNGGR